MIEAVYFDISVKRLSSGDYIYHVSTEDETGNIGGESAPVLGIEPNTVFVMSIYTAGFPLYISHLKGLEKELEKELGGGEKLGKEGGELGGGEVGIEEGMLVLTYEQVAKHGSVYYKCTHNPHMGNVIMAKP